MEYQANAESSEDMVKKLFERFEKREAVMPPEQRMIYQKISEMVTGLNVIDIGCGVGVGTNILGREARFAWGLDREANQIEFANQMFQRKNLAGLGQVEFMQFDLTNPPSREFSKFHVITCIEVLEHIADYQKALDTIKRFYDPGKTTLFIATPNRNADKFKDNQDHPWNPHHIKEYTIAEMYDILIKNFQAVTCLDCTLEKPQDLDSKETPIVYRCEGNLI